MTTFVTVENNTGDGQKTIIVRAGSPQADGNFLNSEGHTLRPGERVTLSVYGGRQIRVDEIR